MKKQKIISLILLVLKGILVGLGAILPGISGGTLCVAFGMYQPVMNLLSHPIKELKKNWLTLLCFIAGGAIGFIGLAGVVEWLMSMNETAVICVFIGFVLGTLPDLWREAGKEKRAKGSYVSIVVGFTVVLTLLIVFKNVAQIQLEENFLGFLICGILWGLSFVVPGLSSSTLIIFLGLYEAMNAGIATLSMSVLIPLAIGAAGCMLLLAKPVTFAFEKKHSILSHAIIGAVLASTATIVPVEIFSSISDVAIALVCIIGGTVASLLLGKMCDKFAEGAE